MVQGPTTYRVLAADVVVLTREALQQITKSDVEFETAALAPEPLAPETVPDDETPAVPEAGEGE
jgi:hypothetical protein